MSTSSDDPRLALGHIMVLLTNDVLEQGCEINRDSVLFMLEEAGLMFADPPNNLVMFRYSPLAVACMNEWLATLPKEEWER